MRVAIVTTSWPQHEGDPSGHFVRAYARELERGGDSVVVVSPSAGGAFGWPGAAARIRERPLRAIEAGLWIAGACVRLRRLDVERVVAHWCVPSAWPIALSSSARIDVVSHGGDVRLLAALPRRAARAVVRRISGRASTWTFPSEATKEALLALVDGPLRADVERMAFVRAPPIEMPDVSAAVAERRRQLGARRVAVCVGRLVASKRVDLAIEYVARESDADTLVVVGDGPERERLERLARIRGIDARFVGNVVRSEALAWIGASDFVVHASEAEGLSTVLREAEALGTPIVVCGLRR